MSLLKYNQTLFKRQQINIYTSKALKDKWKYKIQKLIADFCAKS